MRQRGSVGFAAEPGAVPPTTRLGGGSSPRLMALVALVVLGAVAWVGFSNRPVAQDPAARPSFVIAQAPLAPTAQPGTAPQAPPARTEPVPVANHVGRWLRGDDGVMGGLPFGRRSAPTTAPPTAEPSVPLILLTATPWNTQRANRTHGESWVAGY